MFKTISEKIRNAEFAADNGENWLFSKLQEVLKKKFLEESPAIETLSTALVW